MKAGRTGPSFPRFEATKVLQLCQSEQIGLDEAIERVLDRAKPDVISNRAWILEICSGALRWRGRLDFAIDQQSLKKKPTGWIRRVLQLAAYQLIVQGNAKNAAIVSESVDLVREKEGAFPSKFVNAVLRRLSDHAVDWRELPFPDKTPNQQAAWASLPEWMWKRIVADHGVQRAQSYAVASLERPTLWIRNRADGKAQKMESLDQARKDLEAGQAYVQDISSQTLVDWVSGHLKKRNLSQVLDLCAAPGGKSIALAWAGKAVFSSDVDGERAIRLQENLQKFTGGSARWVSGADIGKGQFENFDAVWVDAPCTGSGILRRHPEIRWNKAEKDLGQLSAIQVDLLKKARGWVKPGGLLIYSVCSILKDEASGALAKAGLKPIDEKWLFPQDEPHGDGFYGAVIEL
ncbi:MAG: hypothetical protein JNL01_15300 [Bdellovibrionales bacterium]|nr:hypothetical protein [Bdellovibrionales bacterium]